MSVPCHDHDTAAGWPSAGTGHKLNLLDRAIAGTNDASGYQFLSDVLARLAQSNQKLSRGLGLANVYNLHKGKHDIPDGSAGMAVIQEAQKVRIFNQDKADAARWCVDTFGLNEESFETIQHLPTGHHLLKVGSHEPETEVEHVRYEQEISLTDTDHALRGPTEINPHNTEG